MKDRGYAMISQPMLGRTEREIREKREEAIKTLEAIGYEVLDNTGGTLEPIEGECTDGVNISLFCLAGSIATMAKCDAVYFCKGWQDARRCRIEHLAAIYYGVKVLFAER